MSAAVAPTPTARRAELTVVAGEVLERVGLDEFGLGALARAAGIKPPSLYKHFDALADLEAALISDGFARMTEAIESAASVREFAAAYRAQALARPQRYRLMTTSPLDRDRLTTGAEQGAMARLLALFGETAAAHPRARALWAWAHGLVALEIDERFPPGADLDTPWELLIETGEHWRVDGAAEERAHGSRIEG